MPIPMFQLLTRNFFFSTIRGYQLAEIAERLFQLLTRNFFFSYPIIAVMTRSISARFNCSHAISSFPTDPQLSDYERYVAVSIAHTQFLLFLREEKASL